MSQDRLAEGEVTGLLQRLRTGDEKAADQLFPLVYDELRRAAQRALRREREDHTLRPTELVHEAWFKLAGPTPEPLHNRAHFLGVAARAMRQVLVDHARRRNAGKRGGAFYHTTIDGLAPGEEMPSDEILALDDALTRLGEQAPRLQTVVEFRYFSGLTDAEIGELLGVSERTVHRDWLKARAWLYKELYPSR